MSPESKSLILLNSGTEKAKKENQRPLPSPSPSHELLSLPPMAGGGG